MSKETSSSARQKAATAWTAETTKNIVLNPDLAEEFAKIIDEIWNKPWLGNATTEQLIDELKARCEINGTLNYRTVDES